MLHVIVYMQSGDFIMPSGRVKWFDPKKGFGFIIGPEGQDVFIHYTQINTEGFRSLKDGELVNYELIEGDKGWHAKDCERADEGESSAEGAEADSGDVSGE